MLKGSGIIILWIPVTKMHMHLFNFIHINIPIDVTETSHMIVPMHSFTY